MSKILIIDDERLIRWSVSRLLERAGYRVSEASTGKDGLAAIEADSPDVVLLDITLPDLDGFSVLRAIRQGHPQIPVLMMTADATRETAQRALRLGAREHLDKPFDPASLQAAVFEALHSPPQTEVMNS